MFELDIKTFSTWQTSRLQVANICLKSITCCIIDLREDYLHIDRDLKLQIADVKACFGVFVSAHFWMFSGVSELVIPAGKKNTVPNTSEKQSLTVMDG